MCAMSSEELLATLKGACRGPLAAGNPPAWSAIRLRVDLDPAGDPSEKVLPPTYASEGTDKTPRYAIETRWVDGQEKEVVILNSVQAEANRMERALLLVRRRAPDRFPLPLVTVRDKNAKVKPLSTLDVPGRIYDAYIRDARTPDDEQFEVSPIGQGLARAQEENATAAFEYCPSGLLLGMWNSYKLRDKELLPIQGRFARCLTSEIFGYQILRGVNAAQRQDPLGLHAKGVDVYASADGGWTLEKHRALRDKDKPVPAGSGAGKGKPSGIGYGSIPVSVSEARGGVSIQGARQVAVLSFPQLRRLYFPAPEAPGPAPETERDVAGRVGLAAMGLLALSVSVEEGYRLRSRCDLIPREVPQFELVGIVASQVTPFRLSAGDALDLFTTAYEEAKAQSLTWQPGLDLFYSTEQLALWKAAGTVGEDEEGK